MAHGALHSTPESVHERQPVLVGDRWVLAVDGRIDNRQAVSRELGLCGEDLDHLTDADLFTRAWLHWGLGFSKHVVGEFALVVWDRQERRLQLVRDGVGQRPLFFAKSTRLLAFASEPESLLGLDGISHACDEDALAYLLASHFHTEDYSKTFYRDVRRVLPGEVLHATATGDVALSRHWHIQPARLPNSRDPREYVESFREVFGEAVRCRLRSLHRPALMLSGGIDSASVLTASHRVDSPAGLQRLLPISLVGESGQACEETRNIFHLLGDSDGIRVPMAGLSGNPLLQELCDATWARAHPVDNSILYARLCCLVARQAGTNVLLDGADGDVVMYSEGSQAGTLALAGHPLRALREAKLSSRFHTYLQGVSPWRILLHGLAATLQPSWLAEWRYRQNDGRRGDAGLGPWIDGSFARRLHLRERSLEMVIQNRRVRAHDDRAGVLIGTWWNPGLIRSMEGADRTAACFGVEARHPWCDQRVLEFFLGLPEDFVARDGWTKWIARTAYAEDLGGEVAWHTGKRHLGSGLVSLVADAGKECIAALLAEAEGRLHGVVDAEALSGLRAVWAKNCNVGDDVDIDQVMLIATLAAWMKRFDLHAG
ncbi:asparagine synthase-related protein [Thermomonas sp.]|uniref:asparagine synthetase B family protein n=1 Tax=Thermomonas sp. TaxID=1971895 RepID=UPI00248A3E16|nr:asparagine synthase-related protein [Thermomonas sp.]MDI1253487.1 asparagine synthase-related protein [Thermomonas sp.]